MPPVQLLFCADFFLYSISVFVRDAWRKSAGDVISPSTAVARHRDCTAPRFELCFPVPCRRIRSTRYNVYGVVYLCRRPGDAINATRVSCTPRTATLVLCAMGPNASTFICTDHMIICTDRLPTRSACLTHARADSSHSPRGVWPTLHLGTASRQSTQPQP